MARAPEPADRPAIAYLVSEYPHIRHAYLLREIRGLRKLGWNIETLAMRHEIRASGNYTAEEREERDRCFYVLHAGASRILGSILGTLLRQPAGFLRGLAASFGFGRRGLFYFAEALVAGRHVQARGIAHVHTHYASTVALLMRRIFPVEVSMSIHGSGEFDEPRSFHLADKIAASDFVRAISFFGRSQIMRACPADRWESIEVCRLGVDPAAAPDRPLRRRDAAFRLLCVGGMAPPRAFDVLIEAVAALRNPAISLTLVGDGPDRGRLEKLAARRNIAGQVEFAGWKTQDELRPIYAGADAFVFSSFAEGVPVVLMEAMSAALPCVAPWLAGIPELIRDGVDGLLTAPSDAAGMAAAIARLYESPELCRSLGDSARARIEKEYNLERNIELLSEILSRRLTTRPA